MPSKNPRPLRVAEAFERAGWVGTRDSGLAKMFPGGVAVVSNQEGNGSPRGWKDNATLGFYSPDGRALNIEVQGTAANLYILVTKFMDKTLME